MIDGAESLFVEYGFLVGNREDWTGKVALIDTLVDYVFSGGPVIG